jgi:hypothetical protein
LQCALVIVLFHDSDFLIVDDETKLLCRGMGDFVQKSKYTLFKSPVFEEGNQGGMCSMLAMPILRTAPEAGLC